MTKKKKINLEKVKKVLPYAAVGVVTLLAVFFGSLDKRNGDVNLSLEAFAADDFKISVDQLSELYVVADLRAYLLLLRLQDKAGK